MARKLTKKQKGFVKDYLETGNATEAAIKNYDVKDRTVAKSIGTENLSKPAIQIAVDEAFPDSELYELHREGLYEGDLSIRHKYLDTAYKLKGAYAPEKHDLTTKGEKITDDKALDEAAKLYGKLVVKRKVNGEKI